MNAQHTPTPWDLHIGNADAPGYFKPADVDVGGHYRFRVGDVAARHADAAFIVRACNSHDALVAALKFAKESIVQNRTLDEARNDRALNEAMVAVENRISAALAAAGEGA